jgi:hypothetical protein
MNRHRECARCGSSSREAQPERYDSCLRPSGIHSLHICQNGRERKELSGCLVCKRLSLPPSRVAGQRLDEGTCRDAEETAFIGRRELSSKVVLLSIDALPSLLTRRDTRSVSKMRLRSHGGVAGRLPAFGGTHILPCMLRFFACPAIAFQATADRPAFAENLYLINRPEVPPSGGALNPDSPF